MGENAASKRVVLEANQPRTDFLQQLLAQVNDLRSEAAAASLDDSGRLGGELATRLRRLAATATGLDYAELALELSACEAVLRGAGVLGCFDEADTEQLEEAFDRIAAFLANSSQADRTPTSGPMPAVVMGRAPEAAEAPINVLVLGPPSIVAMLEGRSKPRFSLQRVEAASSAERLLKKLTPDIVVVDGDTDGARDFVERLMEDTITDGIPVVALGTWETPEQAAPFIALGVARCLAKPLAPEQLRNACAELTPLSAGSAYEPVGTTTLDQLGARLANELHRSLCDAAEDSARSRIIDFGDGADVLTTLWGAVSRIRELVTSKSHGAVRFQVDGAECAMPDAPWLASGARRLQSQRAVALGEVRRTAEPCLSNARIVVAEDDLSMNWFLSGVMREAGATVLDAFDGHQALDHAFRSVPDLVLSDVVMPGVDGFALCRSLKRDVVLRGVPVILLSWKEDLLQRAQELGAGADGYLCKEATGHTISQRVLEVLRPRRTVAARIERGGLVRGRLDSLTPYTLLHMVSGLRPNARVTVRDALHVYEIDMRAGAPVWVSRSDNHGAVQSGIEVLEALLGVGAGRFAVNDAAELPADRELLEGSLDELLRPRVALARASQGLVAGPRLVRIERVVFDEPRMRKQIGATPEPSRGLLRALTAGASPRELVTGGRVSPALLEAVLCDASRHGAIAAVIGRSGDDELPEAIEREIAMLEGRADDDTVRQSLTAFTLSSTSLAEPYDDVIDGDEVLPEAPDVFVADDGGLTDDVDDDEELPYEHALSPSGGARLSVDVVFDESRPPMNPLADGRRARLPGSNTPILASAAVRAGSPHNTPVQTSVVESRGQLARLSEPLRPFGESAAAVARSDHGMASLPSAPRSDTGASLPSEAAFTRPRDEDPKLPRLPSAYASHEPTTSRSKKGPGRFVWPLVFGVLGIAIAIGARYFREHHDDAAPPLPQQPQAAPLPGPDSGEAAPTPTSTAASRPEALPIELPISPEDKATLSEGQGLLEVVAGRNDEIHIDGRLVGKGPVVKVPVIAVEEHEVRVKLRGEERVRYVAVKEGTRTRLRVAPPWSR